MSAKAKVDELSTREFYPLWEHKIYKIHAEMLFQVYWAEMVTTIDERQCQVCLYQDRQAATKWCDVDRPRAEVWSEHEIQQVIHAKLKLLNNYSNIMNDNYCRKSWPSQQVSDAHLPNNLLKWRLCLKKRFMGWQKWSPTSVWNFSSIYPMLRLDPPPGVLLIWTALWISWRGRLIVSHLMSRGSLRRNSPSTWSSLKLGGR